jgi:hypothetical protein
MFDGQHSLHGIYLHARPSGEASITYRLDGRFDLFRSEAVISEMLPHQGDTRTPLILEVRGDGRMLWRSRPLARQGHHRPRSVSVKGIDELSPRVLCRGPENRPGGHHHPVEDILYDPKPCVTHSITEAASRTLPPLLMSW